jgi:hypothetical protein
MVFPEKLDMIITGIEAKEAVDAVEAIEAKEDVKA